MTRVYASLWGKLLVMAMLLTSVAGGKSSQLRKPTPPQKTCAPYHPGIQGNVGEGSKGIICCPLECRQCGGVGCRKNQPRGLSGDDCCVSGVLRSQGDCSDRGAKAPCIIEGPKGISSPQKEPVPVPIPVPMPPKKPRNSSRKPRKPSRKPRKPSRKPRKPSRKPRKPSPPRKPTSPQKTCAPYHPGMKGNVVQNGHGIVCCPLACGTCGGPECASNKCDGLDCCIDDIIRKSNLCATPGTRPPCVIDGELFHRRPAAPIFTPKLNTNTSADCYTDPRADPSTNSCADPSTDTGTDACADSGTNPGTDPSTDSRAHSRADSCADPSTDPGTYSGTDSCADSCTDSCANPSTYPSTDPRADSCANPSTDPSTYPSTYPSTNSRADSRTDSRADPSTYPSTNAGANARANAGASSRID
ncbi:unnamed protein product [Ectocarpus sp. 4 AP-2014]